MKKARDRSRAFAFVSGSSQAVRQQRIPFGVTRVVSFHPRRFAWALALAPAPSRSISGGNKKLSPIWSSSQG